MATHDTATVNALRKRVLELVEGELVRDQEAGEYSTGAIPVARPEHDELLAPRTEAPDVPDDYDDVAQISASGDPDADELPPIGRDADAPRERRGLFRRRPVGVREG
jgi:cell division transport system ATP-binding protein